MAILAVAAATAGAQPGAIEDCRQEPTDGARIACLEAALADGGAQVPAADDKEAAASSNDTSAVAPEADETAVEALKSSETTKTPRSIAGEDEADGRSPRETSPDTGTADNEIGTRQVRMRNQTSSEREASLESATGLRVAGYSEVPYRRLQVILENGQVWRQIAGDTQRLRVDLDRNQTVDITESRLGGYRLRLNEVERTIRVQRIR